MKGLIIDHIDTFYGDKIQILKEYISEKKNKEKTL